MNAYSYVLNNPLSLTDPSGFFFSSLFKAIGRAIKAVARAIGRAFKAIVRSAIGRAILQIIACMPPHGTVTCAPAAGALTLAAGGSIKDALIATAVSFAQMGVYNQIHVGLGQAGLSGAAAFVAKAAVHGVVGGAASVATGGSFESGFASGAVAGASGFLMESTPLGAVPGNAGVMLRTAVAALAGGTASVLSGGKFANGAITGAMAQLFNAEASLKQYALAGAEIGVSFIPGVGELQDLEVMAGSGYSLGERLFAGVSLVANVLTAGALPNAGAFIRGASHLCSFEGETKVRTEDGFKPIKDIEAGEDWVWARNEHTGEMGFRPVIAQYSNPYEDRVHLTIRDVESGAEQTIVSNRIHPYYVSDAARSELRLVASGGVAEVGTNATGRWVEAQHLAAGDRLLDEDATFSEVVAVRVEAKPLAAYNLEVAEAHTFFVRAPDNDNAPAIWVHNTCDLNKLNHIFGNANHQLGELLSKFGGDRGAAFDAVQAAANRELAAGHLTVGPNGVLPSAGNVLNVGGVPVQLSGGRVIGGNVSIGSFGGVIRLP